MDPRLVEGHGGFAPPYLMEIPIPMSTSAFNYDLHQFAGRKSFPVAAWEEGGEIRSNGLSYEDYSRMSTHVHALNSSRRLATPDWANNDATCRELIVMMLEERAGWRKPQTGSLKDRLLNAQQKIKASCPTWESILDKLCKEYVELKRNAPWEHNRLRQLEIEIEGIDTQLRMYTKDGGASMIAGVIHFYYRLGMDSVQTGKEIGMKPPHVRQTCWRLRKCYERLRNPKPMGPTIRIDARKVKELRDAGLTYSEIAKQMGFTEMAIITALKRAGLHQDFRLERAFADSRARMRDPNRPTCKHGHPITIQNACVADLKRMGRYICNPCTLAYRKADRLKAMAAAQ